MSVYNVTVDDAPLQFGLSGVEEVKQNIRTIIKTIMGTCPMHRDFGIDPIVIDMPTPAAAALLEVAALSAIENFEPRVLVTDITVNIDENSLVPIVYFTLREEE
ncbi:GPW/gp25 family protein [Paenibacillus sp. E222]|uniref:GPW/gp25 family protein n=1 Tax=Paenibacillus sp. E222 TaxID=2748863 RepID=UPI0015C67408|nr:GPW/gp25 family protein [Paenibacillus sp. E222]QLG39401.1 GPW/gp25 family protein [Paenibacillus sp. E222]